MPKFEYLRTSFPDDVELNALGEKGWELACMYHNTYVFKRVKSSSGVDDPRIFMNEGFEQFGIQQFSQ